MEIILSALELLLKHSFHFMKNVDLERERLFKEALEVIAQNNYDEALKGGNDIWSHVLALVVEKFRESEKQVEKLKSDLELSHTREHGLRANLDIAAKAHEIERAVKRGSIHPDERS